MFFFSKLVQTAANFARKIIFQFKDLADCKKVSQWAIIRTKQLVTVKYEGGGGLDGLMKMIIL